MIKKHILEAGRSMTEMLGTLAVIGVLSIGAIWGYSYAMDKYRANETIKDVTLYAMSASQQMLAGHEELNFSELGTTTKTGYPIDGEIMEEDDRYFEIYVDDVPTGVCERIVDASWNEPLAIFVNDVAYVDSNHICDINGDETPVDMAFQFSADLNQGAFPFGTCEVASDCVGKCAKCEEGLCVSACVEGEVCLQDISTGNMTCCNSENKSGPYCCPSTKNGMCCDENGENCCPWNRPLADKSGNCYACSYENGVDVKGVEDNCNACSNREIIATVNSTAACAIKCPSDKPLRDYNGKCHGCDETSGFPMLGSTTSQCVLKCPDRHLVRHYCAPKCDDGYVQNTYGNCVKCEIVNYAEINGAPLDRCELCGEDFTLYTDPALCIRDCPEGQFRAGDGVCYDCDDETVYRMEGLVKNSYCEQACPGIRVIVPYYESNKAASKWCAKKCADGEYMDWYGMCNNCETGPNKKATAAECAKCTNRTHEGNVCRLSCGANRFRGADGVCYDCTEESPIEYGTECTTPCPNRVVNGYTEYGSQKRYCSLSCLDGHFANNDGECVPCDSEEDVILYDQSYAKAECGKCGDERNFYFASNWAGKFLCLPKCPPETPLRGSNGKCYACDDETKIHLFWSSEVVYGAICETECPNERKMNGYYCVLK